MQAYTQKTTATVDCPKSMVGRVIGKNGETIKALQAYTGSLIQVNQMEEPCQITISGTPHGLSLAISMVADIVKGTFKGFALLRQVAVPGTSTAAQQPFVQGQLSAYQLPQQATQPQSQEEPQSQPVYAPGYGLIPPSQLYGETASATGQVPQLPSSSTQIITDLSQTGYNPVSMASPALVNPPQLSMPQGPGVDSSFASASHVTTAPDVLSADSFTPASMYTGAVVDPNSGSGSSATIACPKSMAGRVIGKNGETIKALQFYTGSLIQVNQLQDPCQITISGNAESLGLAISMVTDIVQGTFKGFALLRQVANRGNSSSQAPMALLQLPKQASPQTLAQPVYAPGYGLIPSPQVPAAEGQAASASGSVVSGSTLPMGMAWDARQSSVLGLHQGGHAVYHPSSTAAAMMEPQLVLPGGGSVRGAYGVQYYPTQDSDAFRSNTMAYQHAAAAGYGAALPADGSHPRSSMAHLMQAASSRAAASQLQEGQLLSQGQGAAWLPRGGGSLGPSTQGVEGLGEGTTTAGAGADGNLLVMDASGHVYYVNPAAQAQR